jgi:hypothetical protein
MGNSSIDWGLEFFPTDGSCGVDPNPAVPVGPNNAQAISSQLQSHSPNGNTPLQAAVDAAVAYYDKLNDGRGHYLLVATDGQPNCDGGSALPMQCMTNADCPAGQMCMTIPIIGGLCTATGGGGATTSIANARMKGIHTYVVGISLDPSDGATLDELATAGGTARMTSPKYYPANDQNSLEQALSSITGQIISCSFAVTSLPMSNQMIVVTVGGNMVPRDANHANGWDLDSATKTLTFYGPACTQLQANPGVVSVGYTCPPPG